MQIEVEKFLAVSTKNNYITTPESCIGRRPMICDSNISYNRRFFCERAVIAGKKEIKKECKFTVKKMKNETIVMRVDSNRFMLSTIGEEIYLHCGVTKSTRGEGVYQILLGMNCRMTGQGFRIHSIEEKSRRLNMTSETIIISETDTMNTFQSEHIRQLTKVFNYRKLEEIQGVSLENIEDMTGSYEDINGNGIFHAGGILFDVIIFIIVICLTYLFIKRTTQPCSCVQKRKYQNNHSEGDDLPIECDVPIVKKSSNKTKGRLFETVEMTELKT